MASFASIVILLVLFWLVFSIVGLHVFGGLKIDVPWPNCDTLINSLIINFNVSSGMHLELRMSLVSVSGQARQSCTHSGPDYDPLIAHACI